MPKPSLWKDSSSIIKPIARKDKEINIFFKSINLKVSIIE